MPPSSAPSGRWHLASAFFHALYSPSPARRGGGSEVRGWVVGATCGRPPPVKATPSVPRRGVPMHAPPAKVHVVRSTGNEIRPIRRGQHDERAEAYGQT